MTSARELNFPMHRRGKWLVDTSAFTLRPCGLFEDDFLICHDGSETVFLVTRTEAGWIGRERARLRERQKLLAGPCSTPEQVIETLIKRQHMTERGRIRLPDLTDRAQEIRRRGPGK